MREEARKLATRIKERTNPKFETFAIGEVVSTHPLTISDGPEILLYACKNLIVTYHIAQLVNSGNLRRGEKVCLIPSADYKKYVVLDKVVQ